MGLSSKFLLLLVVCVAFQTINAWPLFNIFRWRNLGYSINEAADDAEKDVRKELLSVKNRAWKDTNKMLRKGNPPDAFITCVMSVHQDALAKMDESSVRAMNCIENVRTKVNGVEEKEFTPREIAAMKNEFKREIKACRNSSKYELKGCQIEFELGAQKCYLQPADAQPGL